MPEAGWPRFASSAAAALAQEGYEGWDERGRHALQACGAAAAEGLGLPSLVSVLPRRTAACVRWGLADHCYCQKLTLRVCAQDCAWTTLSSQSCGNPRSLLVRANACCADRREAYAAPSPQTGKSLGQQDRAYTRDGGAVAGWLVGTWQLPIPTWHCGMHTHPWPDPPCTACSLSVSHSLQLACSCRPARCRSSWAQQRHSNWPQVSGRPVCRVQRVAADGGGAERNGSKTRAMGCRAVPLPGSCHARVTVIVYCMPSVTKVCSCCMLVFH